MEQPPEISLSKRVGLWVAAWLLAAIAMAIPVPAALFFFWMFPGGLFRVISPADWDPGEEIGLTLLVGAWILYLLLTIVGLSQNRRARYFFVYAVLCALLVLNVIGCHMAISDGWKT
jgi:hypothetical protein